MTTFPGGQETAAITRSLRYFTWIRLQDVLVLQGPPLLGVAFALRHPSLHILGPAAMMMIGNLLLMTHVFMLNDWAGLTADLADPNKADRVFTARGVPRAEVAGLTAGLFVLSLFFFARLGIVAFALGLSIAILSALYSLPLFNWKGRPLFNSAAHLVGGVLHFLLGYSLVGGLDRNGVATATFFALIFCAGHLMQEIRDFLGDAANGIRTNAVAFGQRRTFFVSLLLFGLAQVILLMLALCGILPRSLAALLVLFPIQLYWSFRAMRRGFTYASISWLQRRYRALYAVFGLAMAISLYFGRD